LSQFNEINYAISECKTLEETIHGVSGVPILRFYLKELYFYLN